ncbi:MAG: hypothetical protein PHN74_00115 [Candidatus Pacebacteria bacterium]|nr:hypothetical protein [Candidatus Paceibacterota bacterium]
MFVNHDEQARYSWRQFKRRYPEQSKGLNEEEIFAEADRQTLEMIAWLPKQIFKAALWLSRKIKSIF